MSILIEYSVMIYGLLFLLAVVFTWDKCVRSKNIPKGDSNVDFKKNILEKAAANNNTNSETPNFQSKELSNLNTDDDISSIKTSKPSKPEDDGFLGFQKFEFSAATTVNKNLNFKTNEIPTIEAKGELLSFKKYVPDEGNAHKVKIRNIRTALHEIANNGKAGALLTSISHKTGMSRIGALTLLDSLTKNNFTVSVNSSTGIKYYLTNMGKQYCLSKDSNSTPG